MEGGGEAGDRRKEVSDDAHSTQRRVRGGKAGGVGWEVETAYAELRISPRLPACASVP